MISKLREPVNALSHLLSAAAAVIGMAVLLFLSDKNAAWIISLTVYGASLIALFLASGTYHAVRTTPKVVEVFRKVDHAAIYLLIAGSYTPFCVIAFSGFWKWGLLAIIWTLALTGILLKVFIINTPRWVTAGVYVAMGWLCVLAFRQMIEALSPGTIAWLFAGGVIYTLGALVYVTKKLELYPGVFGFHEIWHIFVTLGAAAHFIAVLTLITRASAS
jgi:hemolysin III